MTASQDPAPRARVPGGRRRTALADLVAGLLDARQDPASERFDAELDSLEKSGQITADAARILRYWQRSSVRAVVEYARLVLPRTLSAVEDADDEARRSVEDDAAAWGRAVGEAATAPRPATPPPAAEPPAATPAESGHPPAPTSLEDHRRRLLVAGLTRESAHRD